MLHIIVGAPCSGKSTYVREHAKEGDLRIDYDAIAQTLGAKSHMSEGHIRQASFKARQAVIDYACEHAEDVDSWIIHTSPTDEQLNEYGMHPNELILMETDMETCLARMRADGRPPETEEVIRAYFAEAAEAASLFEGEKSMERLTKSAKDSASFDGGQVKGYAATFVKEPDSYGDIIKAGAFKKSLERWEPLYSEGKRIPLLYGHNMNDPFYNIGHVETIKEDEYGLYVEAVFDAENETAQYVRKLVQEGRLYQFSFAYEVLDAAPIELDDGRKVNELRELNIFEVSLVQIPANQTAVVTDIKAADVLADFVADLKAGRRNSAKDENELQRIGALASEISEVVNGLLTDDASTTDGDAEGESEAQAEFVDAYKQAVKTLLKG